MGVTDRSVTSGTVAQYIESVTPHSVSARTIRRRLQHKARSPDLSPIENMWPMVAQRLTQITPLAATPDQLWQRVEADWSYVPQEHIQSLFESMLRRVATVISYIFGYYFWQEPHFTEVYKFNDLILSQHVIYKINFVVASLIFLGVAFTVASSVYLKNNFKKF
ncbi:transposable element Tcb1 transposase [Trichonephila clavipes]|nr:transposable element Tcb1 transposase [Trichonephila clavipes]